ncbi:MAG: phytanoyl-CoA dioxygenase family protein [Proteobacteria bacterium]|nr:phytanoyl-CoA dioxygenase family protein [Pseudomonadota bacterium]
MCCAPWVEDIARHKGALDAFEGLIGPDILCYSMAFRAKGPDRATHAGWHQDSAYSKIEPIMVLAALALSPVTVENGCLRVIPGSHLGGLLNHADSEDPNSILARGQSIIDPIDESKAVPMVLQPGEVGFFDYRIVHGSGPNLTDDTRLMLLVEMMPASARQGEGRETALLVRGEDAPIGIFWPIPTTWARRRRRPWRPGSGRSPSAPAMFTAPPRSRRTRPMPAAARRCDLALPNAPQL